MNYQTSRIHGKTLKSERSQPFKDYILHNSSYREHSREDKTKEKVKKSVIAKG
jgi:hypothetical protein